MRAELYWIANTWPGRLAILARPRGGDWLADEIAAWKRSGIDLVVSLLTPDEVEELGLEKETDLCRAQGMRYRSFPILDRSVPARSVDRTAAWMLAADMLEDLREGQNIGIHCRAGIGHSALLAACVLISGGIDPTTALDQIAAARGCPVPDTLEQRDWILQLGPKRVSLAASGPRITDN